MTAFCPSGLTALPALRFQLDLSYVSGKQERRDLVLIYDPKYGHYLWHIAEAPPGPYTARFHEILKFHRLWADAAGLFDFASGTYLWLMVRTSKADSIEAAQRAAIDEIKQRLPEVAKHGYAPTPGGTKWPWDTEQIFLQTSPAFGCGFPLRDNCAPGPDEILSINKRGNEWRILRRNHWDEEIVLDRQFKPIEENRVSPARKEDAPF